MPTVRYPKNPNTDTAFVTDDNGHTTRAVKTVLLDGTVDYPKNSNSDSCYVTVDGKKQRALMTADISSEGSLSYPNNSNSTKGYVTVNGKKQRVILTASLVGGGSAPVIEELNVTPSTSAQTITAPEGTDGYSPVNVSAVTSAIDANIQAGNIKNGVTILGTTGTYTGDVAEPKIALYTVTANNKTILNRGNHVDLNGANDVNNYALQYACQGGSSSTTTQYALIGAQNLTTISGYQALYYAFDGTTMVSSTGLNNVTSITGFQALYYAFQNSSVTTADLGSLETAEYKSSSGSGTTVYSPLDHMFRGSSIQSADLSSFKHFVYNEGGSPTSRNGFYYTFQNCLDLTSVDLSSFDALIGGDFLYAFTGCSALTTITYNQTKIANLFSNAIPRSAFDYAFQNCTSLTTPYFIKEAQQISATDQYGFRYMFSGCTSLATTGLTNVSQIYGGSSSFGYTYQNCTSLTTTGLENCFILNGSPMSSYATGPYNNMFSGCTGLTTTGLSGLWMVMTGLDYTFKGCTGLTSETFTNLAEIWSNYVFKYTFQNCTGLTTLSFPNLVVLNGDTNIFANMLSGCSNVTVHFPSNLQATIGSWASVTGGFGGTNTTVLFDLPATCYLYSNNSYYFYRRPSLDTATTYGWFNSTQFVSVWTLSATPSVGDTLYSDSACTQVFSTITQVYS